MPNGHKHIHVHTYNTHKKSDDQMKAIQKQAKKLLHHGTLHDKLRIGILAGKLPQVPDSAMELCIGHGAVNFATRTNMFNPNADNDKDNLVTFDNLTGITPSRTSINDYCIQTAAHKVMLRGQDMVQSMGVFIGADKGAGVLCKEAYFTNKETDEIDTVLLDFDTAGDSAKEGGESIKHSFAKYLFADDVILCNGGCSDSGGGFTKEAMKRALIKEGLAKEGVYIHVNCTSHNDQTNIRNAIETVYGEGHLEKRNVTQYIHAYSDVQKSFPGGSDEIKPLLITAWKHVHGPNSTPPDDFLKRMQEPILTRWMTVGDAAQYLFVFMVVNIMFCSNDMYYVYNSCK